MAMRKVTTKYLPMNGETFYGNPGDLWVDINTGTVHVSDFGNAGGKTLASWDINDVTSLPGTLDVSGQILAAQSGPSGNSGGYSFNGTEGGNDTGMYSAADGDLRFYSNTTQVVRMTAGNLAVNGSVYCNAPSASVGVTYGWDVSGQTKTVTNGGTVDFPNFSGTITVNNTASGCVEMWLAGGSNTVKLGNTQATTNTLTHNSGILGYTWTNNSGGTGPFTFAVVRTRAHD